MLTVSAKNQTLADMTLTSETDFALGPVRHTLRAPPLPDPDYLAVSNAIARHLRQAMKPTGMKRFLGMAIAVAIGGIIGFVLPVLDIHTTFIGMLGGSSSNAVIFGGFGVFVALALAFLAGVMTQVFVIQRYSKRYVAHLQKGMRALREPQTLQFADNGFAILFSQGATLSAWDRVTHRLRIGAHDMIVFDNAFFFWVPVTALEADPDLAAFLTAKVPSTAIHA
ncbi:MAG: hypothetical protein ACRCYS_08240 [Beijerinckiaceae bacterium]